MSIDEEGNLRDEIARLRTDLRIARGVMRNSVAAEKAERVRRRQTAHYLEDLSNALKRGYERLEWHDDHFIIWGCGRSIVAKSLEGLCKELASD